MSGPFVTEIDIALAQKMRQDLESQGFEISVPPHTLLAAKKKGVSCTLYQSGKLVVQGKEMGAFIEFYLEPEILKACSYTYGDLELDTTGRIGIDESGKGDFFGPLCIAGVYAEGQAVRDLKAIGVKDSKAMSDSAIRKVARQICESHVFHVVRINPLKYNELYSKFGNLNHLLAWGHATAIEQLVLKTQCEQVIIDQFAAEHVVITALRRKQLKVQLTQRHRGEEDVVVAAASIVARQAFLDGLERLGEQYGINLPKGASALTISVGKQLVAKHGQEVLQHVGKLHFKTMNAIVQ